MDVHTLEITSRTLKANDDVFRVFSHFIHRVMYCLFDSYSEKDGLLETSLPSIISFPICIGRSPEKRF